MSGKEASLDETKLGFGTAGVAKGGVDTKAVFRPLTAGEFQQDCGFSLYFGWTGQ